MRSVRRVCMFISAVGLLSGCDDYSAAPQQIKADQRTYFACSGYVRVHTEQTGRGRRYEVAFTDAAGVERVVSGVTRLERVSIPSHVSVPMPSSLPDPVKDKDDDGLPFKNGWVYTWPNGTAAKLISGRWTPIKDRHPACDRARR